MTHKRCKRKPSIRKEGKFDQENGRTEVTKYGCWLLQNSSGWRKANFKFWTLMLKTIAGGYYLDWFFS